MGLTLSSDAVEAALGGSLAAEELKGDFALAEAAANAESAAADIALVSALRGDVHAAWNRLLGSGDGPGARDAAAAIAAGSIAAPDSAATNALDALAAVVPASAEGAGPEASLVAALPRWRHEIKIADDPRAALAGPLSTLAPLAGTWPFATLAAADLCRRAGDHEGAAERLAAADAAYQAQQDSAGVGACRLADGDWRTLQAATVVTLGLRLSESSTTDTSELHGEAERALFAPAPDGRADVAYDLAETAFAAAGAPRGLAAVALRRAALAALRGEEAAAHAGDARARFDEAGDARMGHLAWAHLLLADVAAGRLPEEVGAAEEIGAWGRRSGSVAWAVGIGMLFAQMGWRWLRRDGDADRALACHRLAEATFAAVGAELNRQQSLGDQAAAHALVGNPAAATLKASAALAAAEALPTGDDPGRVFAREGRLLSLMMRRRQIAHAVRDADALEATRPEVARLHARLSDWARGEGIPLALGPFAAVLQAHSSIAAPEVGRELERDDAAVPLYRALAFRAEGYEVDCEEQRGAAMTAAAAAERRGELEAMILLAFGERDAARQAYERAPSPAAAPGDADGLAYEAALLTSLGAWGAARSRHEALAALRESANTAAQSPWLDLGDEARVAEGLGDHASARELYDRAIGVLEQRRSRLVTGERRAGLSNARAEAALYGRAACAAAQAGDHERAFGYAERGRARAVLDGMAGAAARADRDGGPVRAWRVLTARIALLTQLIAGASDAELQRELADAESELEALETALRERDPRWARVVDPAGAVLDTTGVGGRLGERTLLLAHFLTEEALLAWAITCDGLALAHSTAVAEDEVHTLLGRLASAGEAPRATWQEPAERLGSLLLDPFGDLIAAHAHVVLVSHRRGHLAPLHALPWDQLPLILSKTVSVLPSASAVGLLPAPRPPEPAPGLLAVGDPEGMARRRPGEREATGGFRPARWIGAQAAEAAAAFGGDPPLLGAAAREADVVDALPRHDIVHFGTHGQLDATPLLSCIVLAAGDTLDVWELPGLPLEDRLLVLAACETAGAPLTAGDELVGLGWFGLAAGARGVVASQWKVDELATALLMRAFYRELGGGRPAREALALAQAHVRALSPDAAVTEVRALESAARAAKRPVPTLKANHPLDFSHPHFWAGFVLIGL